MVFGLPAIGEGTWGQKILDSINFLKGEQDGRLSDATLSATFERVAAPPNGVNDTATIEDAITNQKRLRAGVYAYTGTGVGLAEVSLLGHSKGYTTISLPAGVYLIDANQQMTGLTVQDIRFSGGAGAIRNRSTVANVQPASYDVTRCKFIGYTGTAISTNSSDEPYWRIRGNTFQAANTTSSMGVALNGAADQSIIADNAFLLNRVHVKLGQAGSNVRVHGNDFIRLNTTAPSPRIDMWIVPGASGTGFEASGNKFGNENHVAGDYRVLYADELAGTYTSDRFPNLAADSTGSIQGHDWHDNQVTGAISTIPFAYTTTPNVTGCRFSGTFHGTAPAYVLQYRTVPGVDRRITTNVFGPWYDASSNTNIAGEAAGSFQITNGIDVGQVIDPIGQFDNNGAYHPFPGASDGVGHTNLLTTLTGAFLTGGSGSLTKVATTDALGGTEALEVTTVNSGDNVYAGMVAASVEAGKPAWVEIDLAPGSSASMTEVNFKVSSGGASADFERNLQVPASGWKRFRFRWTPRATAASFNVVVGIRSGATAGKFKVGRVRVYHAREPMPAALVLPLASTTTTAPAAGGGGALPATPAGYVTIYVNGVARQIAYY